MILLITIINNQVEGHENVKISPYTGWWFEQILLCGEAYEYQLSEYQNLPFTNPEGKITCILIIELRILS